MLQQTQVDRVLPKYAEWLDKYPSMEVLAEAPEQDVTRTWYPLGYNIRPKRLQSIARESVAKYGGQLPSDEATLLSFKGIGAYTAGAIRSFAFRERAAILDTNVARVLFRVFVAKGDPKSHAMKQHLWKISETLVPHAAGLRLQPGADGLRRDGLRRAESEVPGLPDDEELPRLPVHAWTTMTDDRRRPRPSSSATAAFSSPAGRKAFTSRASGNFPAASATRTKRSTSALRASCAKSSTSPSRVGAGSLHDDARVSGSLGRAAFLPMRAARGAAAAARSGDALGRTRESSRRWSSRRPMPS